MPYHRANKMHQDAIIIAPSTDHIVHVTVQVIHDKI